MTPQLGVFTKADSDIDIAIHAADIDAHVAEMLANLLIGANIVFIPTNAGWTGSNTNSGSTTLYPTYMFARTGATATSRGMAYTALNQFSAEGADSRYMSWDKKLYWIFRVQGWTSNALVVRRYQIKQADTEGALANKGIGIRLDNFTLVGESYGTELGELDLATVFTSFASYLMVIILDPSVPSIKWYVNGTLVGTQSTAAKIPRGVATVGSKMMLSILSGDPGADTTIEIGQPRLWQAR